MRKLLAWSVGVLIFLVSTISTSSAQEFKDVPPKSWAAEFVTKAVKAGILSGFPDGTFRGNKPISRFEIAKIVTNLMDMMGTGGGVGSGNLDELQTELKAIKAELRAMRKGARAGGAISGTYLGRGRFGGILVGSGGGRSPRSDYRMVLELNQGLPDGNILVHLDTIDAAFNNGSRNDLFRDLIDVQANFPISVGWENSLKAAFTIGPGSILHTEPAGFIVDEEKYFRRPRTSLLLSTSMAGIELNGQYVARGVTSASGVIGTHQLSAGVKLDISNWISRAGTLVSGNIHYVTKRTGGTPQNDLRGDFNLETLILPKVHLATVLGIGSANASGLHVGAEVTLNDMFDTGTHVTFEIHRLGASFVSMAEWTDVGGYDYFDRARRNSTWDIGLNATQKISDKMKVSLLWNLKNNASFKYEGPDALFAFRGTFNYEIGPGTTATISYDQYGRSAKNTTADLLSAGILYHF